MSVARGIIPAHRLRCSGSRDPRCVGVFEVVVCTAYALDFGVV